MKNGMSTRLIHPYNIMVEFSINDVVIFNARKNELIHSLYSNVDYIDKDVFNISLDYAKTIVEKIDNGISDYVVSMFSEENNHLSMYIVKVLDRNI